MRHAERVRSLLDPAVLVAPTLLGAVFRAGDVAVRITEVEAYLGPDDPASHSYRGRTKRNAAMFEAAGVIYCYLSHGIHTAVNVVCGPAGAAQGVLLRAGAVVDGIEIARERRNASARLTPLPDWRLARGPGCLGQALGLTVGDSGRRFGDGIELTPGEEPARIATGPRVGVSRAADVPWRFWIPGERSVTPYRRSPRAPAPALPADDEKSSC
jgi:DNA-3-methyladenine glycosylase